MVTVPEQWIVIDYLFDMKQYSVFKFTCFVSVRFLHKKLILIPGQSCNERTMSLLKLKNNKEKYVFLSLRNNIFFECIPVPPLPTKNEILTVVVL